MTFNVLRRLNYTDGLFLTAKLCQYEQDYAAALSAYALSTLFTLGTLKGLQLKAQGMAVQVSGGAALDASGQLLVWPDNAAAVQFTETKSGSYIAVLKAPTQPVIEKVNGQKAVQVLQPEVAFETTPTGCSMPALTLAELTFDGTSIIKVTDAHVPVKSLVQEDGLAGSAAQSGQVSLRANKTRQATREVSITFDAPFSQAPAISATAQVSDARDVLVTVSAVSPTGATIRLRSFPDSGHAPWASSTIVSWTAAVEG